uniref:CD99 antigen-like protein 2 n=1 Tax=Varanus komodoensis TaxID=61221 RepID=A0A8D2L2U4_VARKO
MVIYSPSLEVRDSVFPHSDLSTVCRKGEPTTERIFHVVESSSDIDRHLSRIPAGIAGMKNHQLRTHIKCPPGGISAPAFWAFAGALVETGTIAGIVSGLAMALIGAVSSYISYQQKKFCFSIQQGLNAEYVKGENMEAVVTEEPQVKYSVLEPQSAEPPPPQENAKV